LFRDAGVPTTFLLTTFYWDNFIHFGAGPQRTPDGGLALTFPMGDAPLSGIAAEDIGKCALGIFKAGDTYRNKTVGIAGEFVTCGEMASKMSKATGQSIAYNDVPPDVYRGFGFPGADDLGNMFQFYRDFADHFRETRDVALAKRLNPELQDFDTWLARNGKQIPIP
ncbi:MAG: NmrA family NAD(P)-binding protein, partial [Vicinamibacteria bacterium]